MSDFICFLKREQAHLRALVRAKLSSFKPGRAESVPPHWPKRLLSLFEYTMTLSWVCVVCLSFHPEI